MPNKVELNENEAAYFNLKHLKMQQQQKQPNKSNSYVQTNDEIIDLTGYLIFITKLKNGIIRLYGKFNFNFLLDMKIY